MKNEINFGKFIAELRKEKGYTQLQLAELMYVTDKTISRWENSSNYQDIETMKQFCSVFNITLDELYAGKRMNRNIFIKHRRKKRALTAFISLLFLAVVFLAFYFVANYNSIKFYTLYVTNSNFDICGGYYFDAKSRNFLQISKINYIGNEELGDFYVEIYANNEIIYCALTDADIFIELTDEIDIENLRMKITYEKDGNNYEEEIEVKNKIRYKNNKFVDLKQEPTKQSDSSVNETLQNDLQKLGYDLYSDYTYLKEEKHKGNLVKKYFNTYTKYYNEIYEYPNGKRFDITYYLDVDKITFQLVDHQNIVLEEFYYNFAEDKVSCITKRCGKWDDVVEDTKAEIISVQGLLN